MARVKLTIESAPLTIANQLRRLADRLESAEGKDPVHLAQIGHAIQQAGMATINQAYFRMGRHDHELREMSPS